MRKQGCTHHWAKTLKPRFERFIQNLEGAEQWRVICPKCGVIQRYPTEPTAPFVCEMCEYSEVKVGGTE
jgi:RNase P subunit RPR2